MLREIGHQLDIAVPNIFVIRDYEPASFGLDVPEGLIREVYIMRPDISPTGKSVSIVSQSVSSVSNVPEGFIREVYIMRPDISPTGKSVSIVSQSVSSVS